MTNLFSVVPVRAAGDVCAAHVACLDSKVQSAPAAFEVCKA